MSSLAFVCRNPSNPVPLPAKSALFEWIPRSEYEEVPALSYSLIKKWLELESVPTEFKWWLTDRWTQTKSEALILGDALDCWMLNGPESFSERFAMVPEGAPRRPTQIQRNAKNPSSATLHQVGWWDDFARASAGKTILEREQMFVIEQMSKNLNCSKATDGGALFQECKKTTAINLELFGGVPWKSEFDLWHPNTDTMCDLKIARDVTAPVFGRDFVNWGYAVQACVYLSMAQSFGFDKKLFALICVKREPPYTVKVHRFNLENDRHAALFKSLGSLIATSVARLLEAVENNFVDDGEWVDLQLPDWALRASQNQELLLMA
jgi:PDDEXK-like domain of unknown function (DUF3799)